MKKQLIALALFVGVFQALADATLPAGSTGVDIQAAIDAAAALSPAGTVTLSEGTFEIDSQLYVTNGVTLVGQGWDKTTIKPASGVSTRLVILDNGAKIEGVTLTGGSNATMGSGYGAAVWVMNGTVSWCCMTNNSVSNAGGNPNGGAVSFQDGQGTIDHCIVANNSLGALYCRGAIGAYHQIGPVVVDTCLVCGNSSGISNCSGIGFKDGSSGADVTIRNCTVAGNTAGTYQGGGIVCEGGSTTFTIANTIATGNMMGTSENNLLITANASSKTTVQSCLFGLQSEADSFAEAFSADPLFVDAENGNYELQGTSPAKWVGKSYAGIDKDLNGNDFAAVPTIGCYEVNTVGLTPSGTPAEVRQAIQAAIDAAAPVHGGVLLGEGIFEIDSQLYVTNGVSLVGQGWTKTTIKSTHLEAGTGYNNAWKCVTLDQGAKLECVTVTGGNCPGNWGDGGAGVNIKDGTVSWCCITNNYSNNGGSVRGGGVYISKGTIDHSIIANNRANNGVGGGIGGHWDNGKFVGPVVIDTCLIYGNTVTTGDGGGLGFTGDANAVIQVRNTTIVGNSAPTSGGGISAGPKYEIVNSIICGNTAASGANVNCTMLATSSNNLIDQDVAGIFTDAANGDYHLPMSSPAVWAGVAYEGLGNDLAGVAFDSALPSVGCYEYTLGGLVKPLAISPGSGSFYPSVTVTITCGTEDAEIRYTTDDSEPTESSALYTGPLTVEATTTIKAKGFKSGLAASATVSATYTYSAWLDGDYYVSPDGSDSNNGLTRETAFRTISKAVTTVGSQTDKTISLAAGTYDIGTGQFGLKNKQRIIGAGWQDVVITGSTGQRMFKLESGSGISGVTLTGYTGTYRGAAVHIADGSISWCCVSNVQCGASGISSNYGAAISILKGQVDHCMIVGNRSSAGQEGVAVGSSTVTGPVLIDSCLIVDNRGPNGCAGVRADINGSYNYTIRNCTIYGNRQTGSEGANASGVHVTGSGAGKLTLIDNIISGNFNCLGTERNIQITSARLDTSASKNCVVTGATSSGGGNYNDQVAVDMPELGFVSTFSADTFVDSANGDFHLADGASVIGAGVTYTGIGLDLDKVAYANPPSLGCYEYVASVQKVAAPEISPAAGAFYPTATVTISCATDGATIYYTTNGDDPTDESTEYTEPIELSATATIKAIALKAECTDSPVVSATYIYNPPLSPVAGDAAATRSLIQNAIDAVAPIHGTVTLNSGTFEINQQLYVTNGVTLTGQGWTNTVIRFASNKDGTDYRAVNIVDGTVSHVTLTGGRNNHNTGCGGGVQITGGGRISWCCITNNYTERCRGGGVYVGGSGDVRLDHTILSGNTAAKAYDLNGGGGGIYVRADSAKTINLEIDSCLIAGNASGHSGVSAPGGGLVIDERGTVNSVIRNTTVAGNSVIGTGVGGGLYVSQSNTTLINCIVSGNAAEGAASFGDADVAYSSSEIASAVASKMSTCLVGASAGFVGNGDYRLASGSAAINAGAAYDGIGVDLDNVVFAEAPSIGCYEANPEAVVYGWTAAPMSASGEEISTKGTLKYAYARGSNGQTNQVNGVDFATIWDEGDFVNKQSNVIFSPTVNFWDGALGDEGLATNFGTLLNHGFKCNRDGYESMQITLNGLEAGKSYLVQLITHKHGSDFTITVGGVTAHTGGTGWTYGGTLIGKFIADSTTKTFTLACTGGMFVINAVQLRELALDPVVQYAVTWSGAANATVDAKVDGAAISSGANVEDGKSVVFTVTPDTGYEFAAASYEGWTLSGGVLSCTKTVDGEALAVTIPDATEVAGPVYELGWTAEQMTANGAGFRTDGTLLYAYSADGTPVNGVSFVNKANASDIIAVSDISFSTAPTGQKGSYGDEGQIGEFADMLKSCWIWSSTQTAPITVTLSGLTAGKTYLVQLLAHRNNVDTSKKADLTLSVEGKSAVVGYADASTCYGASLVGIFIAEGTTQSFQMTYAGGSNASKPLNAIQVRELSGAPAPTTYAVTWSGAANATVSAKVDGTAISSGANVLDGKSVVFTVTPDTGYEFAAASYEGWTLTGGVLSCTKTVDGEALAVTIPDATAMPVVETPVFSPAAGTITEATDVTITCSTTDAVIYYTTNGDDPTSSSTQYSAPIAVSATTTIKAIAVKTGMLDSSIASATYTYEGEGPAYELGWTGVPSIAEATSVRTDGSLVYAYSKYGCTANGVTFTAVTADSETKTITNSDITWALSGGIVFDKNMVCEGIDDQGYKDLLSHSWGCQNQNPHTIELKGLTAGRTYLVQVFCCNYNGDHDGKIYVEETPGQVFDENTPFIMSGDETRPSGTWAYGGSLIGIFEATSSTYTVTMKYKSGSWAGFNAVQLRDLNVEPVVKYAVTWSGAANATVAATVDTAAIASGDEVADGKDVVFTVTPDTNYEFTAAPTGWTLAEGVLSCTNTVDGEDLAVVIPDATAVVPASVGDFRKKIEFTTSGYTGSETLADFPVLVRLSENSPTGFSYSDVESDGSDIRFTDANGYAIPFEIDCWNTSGESLIWVKLPAMTSATKFTMYYDGTPSGSNTPASTWTAANYVGVWHMGEASGSVADATGHGLTAEVGGQTSQASSVIISCARYEGSDAPVGYARTTSRASVDGGDGHLVVANDSQLDLGDTFTFSTWVRSASDVNYRRLVSRKTDYRDGDGWEVEVSRELVVKARGASGTDAKEYQGKFNTTILNSWAHVVVVYNGSTISVYENGVLIGENTESTGAQDNDLPLVIGANGGDHSNEIYGAFDECRLLDAVASADWVKAEYQQGVASYAFLSNGGVEPVGDVDYYAVTWSGAANATVDAKVGGAAISSGANVLDGKSVVFTVTPDTGYEFAAASYEGWTLSGGVLSCTTNVNGAALAVAIPDATAVPVKDPEDYFAKKIVFTIGGFSGTSTLVNFPVLVKLSTSISDFDYAECPQDSIRFVDESGNNLPFEVDTWNASGTSYIWVSVPEITGTTTTFTMYYGGDGDDWDVPAGNIWALADYKSVWHMDIVDGASNTKVTSDSAADNTASVLRPNEYCGAGTGLIGGDYFCHEQKAYSHGIQAPSSASASFCPTTANTMTYTVWVRQVGGAVGATSGYSTIQWSTWGNCGEIWHTGDNNGNTGTGASIGLEGKDSAMTQFKFTDKKARNTCMLADIYDSEWHQVVVRYDAANVSIWIDGVALADSIAGNYVNPTGKDVFFGTRNADNKDCTWTGDLDELRFRDAASSDDWIAAEYANVMTDTFVTNDGAQPLGNTVAKPVFDPASVVFYPTTNVTITCATDGATIYYTVNGDDPTSSSTEYTAPIAVSATTTIKAIAIKEDMTDSAVVSATYTYEAPQPVDPSIGGLTAAPNGATVRISLTDVTLGSDSEGVPASSCVVYFAVTNSSGTEVQSGTWKNDFTGGSYSQTLTDFEDGVYTCYVTITTDQGKSATRSVVFTIDTTSEEPTIPLGWTGARMTSDSSLVKTDGGCVFAYARGAYTVNGVSFALPDTSAFTGSGDTLVLPNVEFGIVKGWTTQHDYPVDTGSDDYVSLMKNGWWLNSGTTMTLKGLAVGHTYLVQVICYRPAYNGGHVTVNGETLEGESYITSGAEDFTYGGTIYGVFTADAVTKVIQFISTSQWCINGFQLRDVTPARTLEPGETAAETRQAIQDEIDAVAPYHGTVILGEGTFEIDEQLYVTNGVTLQGKGWDKTIVKETGRAQSASSTDDPSGKLRCAVVDGGATIVGMTLTGAINQGGNGTAGGGVWVKDGIISWCCISNNMIRAANSKFGGGVSFSSGKGRIDHSIVADNTATHANADTSGGGGIGIDNPAGEVLIDTCLICGNHSLNDKDTAAGGGGIMFRAGNYHYRLTIRNSTIVGNDSAFGVGGIYMSQNAGSTPYPGDLAMVNCIVADNVTSASGVDPNLVIGGNLNDNNKAQIEAQSSNNIFGNGTAAIGANSVTLVGSGAILFADAANGDYRLGDASPAIGAGVAYEELEDSVDLDGVDFMNPPSIGCYEYNGKGLEPAGTAAETRKMIQDAIDAVAPVHGTVYLGEGLFEIDQQLYVTNGVTLQGQSRDKTIIKQTSQSGGYGTYNRCVTVAGGSKIVNLALTGGYMNGNQKGAGVLVEDGTVSWCCVTNNSNTGGNGGGIGIGYSEGSAKVRIDHTIVTNNTSTVNGGGIGVAPSLNSTKGWYLTLEIDTCLVTGNKANGAGAGICVINKATPDAPNDIVLVNADIRNTTVAGNQGTGAGSLGGGFYTTQKNTTLLNCVFTDNTIAGTGDSNVAFGNGVDSDVAEKAAYCFFGGATVAFGLNAKSESVDGAIAFVDAANGGYHLSANSPAVSAGRVTAEGAVDLDKVAFAEIPSMGCYEYVSAVAAPVFSPSSGTKFASSQSVTIRGATGMTVRYTTDGSLPTEESPVYSGGLTLTATTTVKARAYDAGGNASAVAVALYRRGVDSADYYVSTTGSDYADGLTPETAFKTIAHAVEVAEEGHKVMILPGTFEIGETIVVDKAITVTGSGWDDTIIKPTSGTKIRLFKLDGGAKLEGVTLTGGTGTDDCNGGAAWVKNGTISWCCITNNVGNNTTVTPNGAAVTFHNGQGTIDHCIVRGNTGSTYCRGAVGGADMTGPVVVDACLICGNNCWYCGGVGFSNLTGYGVTIQNCTIVGNTGTYASGSGGIFFDNGINGGVETCKVINTIVTDNKADGSEKNCYVSLNATGCVSLSHCFFGGEETDLPAAVARDNCSFGVPMFTNTSDGDYHPSSGWVAVISKGETYTGIGETLDGSPFNDPPSIGCYESSAGFGKVTFDYPVKHIGIATVQLLGLGEGATSATVTFAYGPDADHLCAPVVVTNGVGVKADIVATMSGLEANSSYYYRFSATDDAPTPKTVTREGVFQTDDWDVLQFSTVKVSPNSQGAVVGVTIMKLGLGATRAGMSIAWGVDYDHLCTPVQLMAITREKQSISYPITGLAPETDYVFRFYGMNDVGDSATRDGAFRTLATQGLELGEGRVGEVGQTSAKIGVTVRSVGDGATSASVTLRWGLAADALTAGSVALGTAVGDGASLVTTLTGLASDTVYYYAIEAENDANPSGSDVVTGSFMTQDPSAASAAHGDGYPTALEEGKVVTYDADNAGDPVSLEPGSPFCVVDADGYGYVYTSTITNLGATSGQEYRFRNETDFRYNASARIGDRYYLFLSDAVDAAEPGDTVELLRNNYAVTKTIVIDEDLTIEGDGHVVKVAVPYLDAQGYVDPSATDPLVVIHIANGGDAKLRHMTVMGGGKTINNYGYLVSAIVVGRGAGTSFARDIGGSTGVLEMDHVTVTRSQGGLNVAAYAKAYVSECCIVRNARWCGGGFYNRGLVVMVNSSLSENRSLAASGGGAACENQGLLFMNNCEICNNGSTEYGGAVNLIASTPVDGRQTCHVYMMNTTMAGNFTSSKTNVGGGIGVHHQTMTEPRDFYMVNCIVCNNYWYDTAKGTCTPSDIFATNGHNMFLYSVCGVTSGGTYIESRTVNAEDEDVFSGYTAFTRTYGEQTLTAIDMPGPTLTSDPDEPYARYATLSEDGSAADWGKEGVYTYFDASGWRDWTDDGTTGPIKMSYRTKGGEMTALGNCTAATEADLVTDYYEAAFTPTAIDREIGMVGASGFGNQKRTYTLFLLAKPENGGVSQNLTLNGTSYDEGTEVTVVATPDAKCTFLGWYDENDELVSAKSAYAFVMNGDKKLRASFSAPSETIIFYNVKCEQAESATHEHGVFPMEITKDWLGKAFPTICPGGNVADQTVKQQVEAALNLPDEANGLNHVWQNYVLGGLQPGDPDGRIWIRADQTSDAATLKFRVQEFSVTKGCGFDVKYRILSMDPSVDNGFSREGAYSNSGSFDENISMDEVRYRAIDMIFVPTGHVSSCEYVTTVNTAGVMKVESSKKIEIIGAPWEAFSVTGHDAVKATDLVKASCLSAEDILYVYDQANANYRAWAVQKDGTWASLDTYRIVNGNVDFVGGADASVTNSMPRGAGAWLERKDPSKPIFLYGQYNPAEVTTSLAPGFCLVASPTCGAFDAGRLPAPANKGEDGDHVIIPTGGTPINCWYDETKGWGWMTNTVQYIGDIPIAVPAWTSDGLVIPPGHGFWYNNSGSGALQLQWNSGEDPSPEVPGGDDVP